MSTDARRVVVDPMWRSKDGRTVVVQGGSASDPNQMVRAADDLKKEVAGAAAPGVTASLTGSSGMWSDFRVLVFISQQCYQLHLFRLE